MHEIKYEDINYLVSKNSITVNYLLQDGDEKTYHTKTILSDDELFADLLDAIKEDRLDDIPELIESKNKRIYNYSDGNIQVIDGILHINNEPVPSDLADRILKHIEEELPYQPLVNFWERLRNNPSYRAVQGLFRFLDANHHPITNDGHFLAYKGVRANYTDIHSGTMDNSIGKVVFLSRNKVNEDPNQTCSYGLHVASYKLAHTSYGAGCVGGAKTLVVKVDPEHVVAVPYEYGNQKMRVCQYTVIGHSDRGEIPHYQVSESDPYADPVFDEDIEFDNDEDDDFFMNPFHEDNEHDEFDDDDYEDDDCYDW